MLWKCRVSVRRRRQGSVSRCQRRDTRFLRGVRLLAWLSTRSSQNPLGLLDAAGQAGVNYPCGRDDAGCDLHNAATRRPSARQGAPLWSGGSLHCGGSSVTLAADAQEGGRPWPARGHPTHAGRTLAAVRLGG